jgi:hypothetical protein
LYRSLGQRFQLLQHGVLQIIKFAKPCLYLRVKSLDMQVTDFTRQPVTPSLDSGK